LILLWAIWDTTARKRFVPSCCRRFPIK